MWRLLEGLWWPGWVSLWDGGIPPLPWARCVPAQARFVPFPFPGCRVPVAMETEVRPAGGKCYSEKQRAQGSRESFIFSMSPSLKNPGEAKGREAAAVGLLQQVLGAGAAAGAESGRKGSDEGQTAPRVCSVTHQAN